MIFKFQFLCVVFILNLANSTFLFTAEKSNSSNVQLKGVSEVLHLAEQIKNVMNNDNFFNLDELKKLNATLLFKNDTLKETDNKMPRWLQKFRRINNNTSFINVHTGLSNLLQTLSSALGDASSLFKEFANDKILKKVLGKQDSTFEPSLCKLDDNIVKEIQSYNSTVQQIIDFVTKGKYKGRTYTTLAEFVDTFGPRLTGTQRLEDSIDRIIEMSAQEGLQNVHTEQVKAPHWVRNNESLWLLLPHKRKLNMLGLGSSIGTGPGGITAEVLVVKSFKELKEKKNEAFGKIVVYNEEYVSYGETVTYRSIGASVASTVGAMAALVRSIAPYSISSPHTGHQYYQGGVRKIPVACITIEDAQMMQRMQDRGQKVVVHLEMGAENLPDTVTRNTIAEVVGSSLPEEAVVIGGHIDSWDVGQGAMDDGGGSFISWNAAVVLHRLGLRARRTVRTVLFSAEEEGIYGGQSYFKNHVHEKEKFQLLLESDIGTFDPLGIAFSGSNTSACIIQEILNLMKSINTTQVTTPMDGGPDIEAWISTGVPTGSLANSNSKYFWYHHSNGDMMTVEDSDVLDKCTAMWAALAYVAADLSIKLP